MKTQGSNTDVVFLSGVRTGFGTFGGTLKDLSAIELGAVAAKQALERSGVPPAEVGHSVFGNALQTSADAIYCARHIGLKAGLPIEVPAVTVNRLCGSGFEAITQGTRSEEHTSELQSLAYLVCRLLLEKKKNNYCSHNTPQ